MEPGQVEIDCSGNEPVIRIGHPQDSYTIQQLRMYAEYLATLADEAGKRPEPEVDELAGIIDASPGRLMTYPANVRRIARDILDAGYERKSEAEGAA